MLEDGYHTLGEKSQILLTFGIHSRVLLLGVRMLVRAFREGEKWANMCHVVCDRKLPPRWVFGINGALDRQGIGMLSLRNLVEHPVDPLQEGLISPTLRGTYSTLLGVKEYTKRSPSPPMGLKITNYLSFYHIFAGL